MRNSQDLGIGVTAIRVEADDLGTLHLGLADGRPHEKEQRRPARDPLRTCHRVDALGRAAGFCMFYRRTGTGRDGTPRVPRPPQRSSGTDYLFPLRLSKKAEQLPMALTESAHVIYN
jgi:hypothetical protein